MLDMYNAPIDWFVAIQPTLYWSKTKYSARMSVWLRHCSTAFMKHVFPWFFKPVTPGIWSGGHTYPPNGGTLSVVVCLACKREWIWYLGLEQLRHFYENNPTTLKKRTNSDFGNDLASFSQLKFSLSVWLIKIDRFFYRNQ